MRHARPLVAGALVAATLAGAAGGARTEAQTRQVDMPGRAFAPSSLVALVGDTILWKNGDSRNHTVTQDDDSFDSGYIAPGGSFELTLTRPGRYRYHCTIHRFMRGEVLVYALALTGPDEPLRAGGVARLTGLAPAETPAVAVTWDGGTRTVRPRPDGSFALALRLRRPTVFRATLGRVSSPRVRVAVAPTVVARRSGAEILARTSKARAGARAALQRYERERFAWVTVARSRVDANARTRFDIPLGEGKRHFRVVVRGSAGWADGASEPVVIG